jgi:hypothetical protein
MRILRHNIHLGALLCSTAVLLFSADVSAHDFRVYLKEQLINKIAAQAGSQSFGGYHVVRTPTYACSRCVERNWIGWCVREVRATCGGDAIFSSPWTATVSDVSFEIDATGMHFTADLSATYGPLPYDTTISGEASIDVDNDRIVFAADRVQVPLVFDVPLVGPVTIHTLDVELPYRVELPIGGFYLPSEGSGQTVSSRAINLTRAYYSNQVRLAGDLKFW